MDNCDDEPKWLNTAKKRDLSLQNEESLIPCSAICIDEPAIHPHALSPDGNDGLIAGFFLPPYVGFP